MSAKTEQVVWCVNAFPERDQQDFIVCTVRPDETNEQAIERAKGLYSADDEFYILTVGDELA